MNQLQQNVANSLTVEKGTFEIKIVSGRYSYAQSAAEGEPLVVFGYMHLMAVHLSTPKQVLKQVQLGQF